MAVILETLRTRYLVILAFVLLVLQIIFFCIGGFTAPSPSTVISSISTKCVDTSLNSTSQTMTKWYFLRPEKFACKKINEFNSTEIFEDRIIFVVQYPRHELSMSRWFQHTLGVMTLDIEHDSDFEFGPNPSLKLDIQFGYRDDNDDPSDWKLIAKSIEIRKLSCDPPEQEGFSFKCDIMSLFEYGSAHHDKYLVNIRLPTHYPGYNEKVGKIKDLWIHEIHQNGGFTMVWFILKTSLFPVIVGIIVWFWKRVDQQPRTANLLEKTLLALGFAMTLLNFPIDWLTLWIDMPFMLLYGDLRQGAFYTVLMIFWIIFTGEHMMDQVERNRLSSYWKNLSAVGFGCICLFVLDICERGVQLKNPFYSIWVTDIGRRVAMSFIILAGIAGGLYFLFIVYMLICVLRNISAKKSALPSMSRARKHYYLGLIYRFKFMMFLTFACASLTIAFFALSQYKDTMGRLDDWDHTNKIEYSSAFFTGVYGMWNLYVFALLLLYAPSKTSIASSFSNDSGTADDIALAPMTSIETIQDSSSPDQNVLKTRVDTGSGVVTYNTSTGQAEEDYVEFNQLPSEASALQAFITKKAQD